MTVEQKVTEAIDARVSDYQQISREIHAKPEVSNYEFFACKRLSDKLREEGFEVKCDVAGHRTGFTATYRSGKPGPVLAFLAEYDALVGLGHGCGHNLFGPTSCLAAVGLKEVLDEIGGEVRVYGTPGEEGGENGSAKGSFVREGFFEDVDAALCVHPGSNIHEPTLETLACAPVDIEFWGRASHAASRPEKGINALDAVIQVYNSINALRQHLPSDVRIHGIIVNGGDAPNIVPEYAKAKFYLRANKLPTLADVYKKVKNIVAGAALATGARGRMQPYQNIVENTIVTPKFDAVYRKNLQKLGADFDDGEKRSIGSSDVGNVSQVIPTIQPKIRISNEFFPGHSEQMVAACVSESGLESIRLGAKVLALTGLDLILDPALLNEIKEDHKNQLAQQGEKIAGDVFL